jgi:putative ABC transport system permease protein
MRNRIGTALAWGTTTIAIVLSSLGVLNTMLVSVLERTREIGVLRAIGWRKSRVLLMIVGEGLLQAMAAIVIGGGLAIVLAMALSHIPAVRELVGSMITAQAIIFGAVPALLATALGCIYPAWRASSIPTTEAIRYE